VEGKKLANVINRTGHFSLKVKEREKGGRACLNLWVIIGATHGEKVKKESEVGIISDGRAVDPSFRGM